MCNQSARTQSRIGVLLPVKGRDRARRGLTTCQITLGRSGDAVSVNYPCVSSRSRSWWGWWPKYLLMSPKMAYSTAITMGQAKTLHWSHNRSALSAIYAPQQAFPIVCHLLARSSLDARLRMHCCRLRTLTFRRTKLSREGLKWPHDSNKQSHITGPCQTGNASHSDSAYVPGSAHVDNNLQ